MPRYELDAKFWEIELAGSKLTQKWGKTGGSVSMNSKDCGTPAAANKAYAKAIANKHQEGFVLVTPSKSKPKPAHPIAKAAATNPALDKAILANLDDADAYLVLADWLQAQGDPRGELIALQHAGKTKQAKALLAKHPELTPVITPPPETFKLEWSRGFLKRVHLGWAMHETVRNGDDEEVVDDWETACKQALIKLLRHPAARFLQSLRLGCIPTDSEHDASAFADAIEKVAPPALRVLELDDTADWDISSTSARCPSSKAISQLRELVITAGHIGIGKLELPELRVLRIRSGSLSSQAVKAIAAAKLPKLETLEIWFGEPRYGASGTVEDLRALFAATHVPKLAHFGMMNCAFADAGVKALTRSKLLKQLRTLDLRMGNLSDRGVDELVAHEDAYAHLELIEVDDNALTEASKPRLRGLAKKVNWGGARARQYPDRAVPRTKETRDWRYVSVGE